MIVAGLLRSIWRCAASVVKVDMSEFVEGQLARDVAWASQDWSSISPAGSTSLTPLSYTALVQHFDMDSGAAHWFGVVRGRDHDADSRAFQSLGPKDGKESSSEYDNGEAVCSRYNVNLTIQTGKRRGYLELRATHSVRNPAVPYE